MVLGKRTREYSTDSNSGCFEILPNDKPISSSPLRIIHDDDVSGTEAMLRRRKQPKTTPLSSSSNSKMAWTKDDELIILGSIVDYEKETKLSHRSDWDAFYGYVKDFIEADFSKKQLIDKIRNLNKRFLGNKARCNDEEGPSFTSTEDDEIFKLSMIIWEEDTAKETECASNENVGQDKDVPCVDHERIDENMDQAKDVPCVEHEQVSENMDQAKDAPCVEHEPVDENMDQAKVDVPYVEHERVDENVDQAKVLDLDKDAPCVEHELVNENMDLDQERDVPCVEHELVNENTDQEEAVPCTEDELASNVSMDTDKGEKEKNEDEFCATKDAALTDKEEKENNEEENGVDEFCALKDAGLTDKEETENSEDEYCALKDALEATTFFQSIGRYQQKLMLRNLETIGAPRRRELADELKELIDEEMKLRAKKLSLTAKLANAWESC